MAAAHTLWQAKERWGNACALSFEGRTWTFAELWQASSAPAAELRARGIGSGDRVGCLVGNRPEWLFWHVAISRVGAVAVPVNPAYTPSEIRNVLAAADLSLLVFDSELAGATDATAGNPKVFALPQTASLPPGPHGWMPPYEENSELPAAIYFSSGSTGQPKGIVHSNRNLRRVAELVGRTWDYRPDDILLLSMPLAFVYASIVGWLSGTKRGAQMLLQRRFDAEAVAAAIRSGNLTVMLGVPNMYRAVLALPAAGGSGRLRAGLTAGDVLPRDLDDAFFARFGAPLFDLYGLTETPHTVSHIFGTDGRSRPLSCGRKLDSIELRILDDAGGEVPPGEIGELVCRTPYNFLSYFRNAQITAEVLKDGWFWTGDLVRQDADGYIYIVDRRKELIKRSGFNVLPSEVEAVILSCPGVLEAGVVGVPDRDLGEKVVAFVVPTASAALSESAIEEECRRQLAKYKVPSAIDFVATLPRGATGKINRKMLREMGRNRHA